MADDQTHDELTRLRAELTATFSAQLAAQQAQIAAQQAAFAAHLARRERPRRRLPRRVVPFALVALLLALTPLGLLAANPVFSDLGLAAPVHQPNIQAIGNAGITTGFDDPDHPGQRLYNPKGLVTREEMATFLARATGLGVNPPVANAQTAITAQSATNAANAANATQLGGQPAAYYQPAGQPIANATHAAGADLVGGYAPNGLVRVARATGANRADNAPRATPLTIATSINATPLPAALQPVVSVALSAPTPGFVLVSGAVYIQTSDSNTGSYPFVYGRVRHAATGAVSPALVCGATTSSNACSLAPTFVFPVAAGNQTFILEVARTASLGTAEAYDGAITAAFIPFAQDGGTTLAP